MVEHGLDYSRPDKVLFTRCPFAAVPFGKYATPEAGKSLFPYAAQIAKSWAMQPAMPLDKWPSYLFPYEAPAPYPLQLAALEYIGARKHAILGDDPGVGKTYPAIMRGNLIAYERFGDPSLFRGLAIVPANLRLQWATQIRRFCTIPGVRVVVVDHNHRDIPRTTAGYHWTVLSYNGISGRGALDMLLHDDNHWHLMVLDEAHYVKSPGAARTRNLFGSADRPDRHIKSKVDSVLALTGTPLPNRPREAYTLVRALCPEAFDWMSERAFYLRYNPSKRADGEVGRTHEFQARFRHFMMVRRLFGEVYTQLDKPEYDLIQADVTGTDALPIRQALEAERLLGIDPETLQGADNRFDGTVATVRERMDIALAPQAARFVRMRIEGGDRKVAVFCWHRKALDILEKSLEDLGVLRVDGSTTERQKQDRVTAFQTDPAYSVMCGNHLSLGTGTDGLQSECHRAILFPDWVYGNVEQCVKRLYRDGQKNKVSADIIVAAGSIAETVLAKALRKGRDVHKALDARIG
jgi:SNF2 family DNA or RNA helicase